MSTRHERERQQRLNESHKNILAVLLSREENKYCADCLAKGPRWVSWNLGVLICIRCSGLHRSLGVHISRVKSVNLDTWTREQMLSFCSRGNGWAKEHFEAKLPADFKRPQNDSSIEYFIRDKYEKKKYISSSSTPLRSLKGLGLTDDVSEPEKSKKKIPKQTLSVNPTAIPRNVRPTSPCIIPRPKSSSQIYKQANSNDGTNTVTVTHRATTDDLLGLHSKSQPSLSPLAQESVAAPLPPSADLTDDLFGPMSSYNSNTQTTTPSGSHSEFLNGIQASHIPDANEKAAEDKKMSKDLILSLYSQGTTNPVQTQIPSVTSYGIPPTSNPAYQQAGGVQFSLGYQNLNPQGMTNPYQGHQQQMMAMQQQQMQMHQQMQNMSLSGMPTSSSAMGYSMMPQQGQQQIPMQNNMGFNMGYAGQPQAGIGQMYANPPNGNMGMGLNQGMAQVGSYNTSMMAGVPRTPIAVPIGNMQGTGVAPGWGQNTMPPAAGMNSGCTLSTQLWK